MGSFAQGALVVQRATTTTSGGTTTLTASSVTWQRFDGSSDETVVLPDATTLTLGRSFKITNRSSGALTVQDDGTNELARVAAGSERVFNLYTNGTSNGDWSVDAQVDLDFPLNLFASRPTPDSILNIRANQVLTSEGMLLSAPPVNDNLDALTDQFCNFNTGTASGSVKLEGGVWTTPVSTANFFRRMALVYVSDASLGTTINTTFSAEAATQGALPDADTLFATLDGLPIGYIDLQEDTGSGGAQYRTPGSAASVIDNTGIIKFNVASGGGGGAAAGNSAQWNPVDGEGPILEEENGVEVYLYEAGITQKLVTHLKVPKGHPQSRQIILRTAVYSPATSGTILLSATTDLIRPDTDSAITPPNSHSSTNVAIANSGTANALRILEIDLTDSVGQINGINAAAGNVLRIELSRGTDTDTEDLRFIPSSTEVVF